MKMSRILAFIRKISIKCKPYKPIINIFIAFVTVVIATLAWFIQSRSHNASIEEAMRSKSIVLAESLNGDLLISELFQRTLGIGKEADKLSEDLKKSESVINAGIQEANLHKLYKIALVDVLVAELNDQTVQPKKISYEVLLLNFVRHLKIASKCVAYGDNEAVEKVNLRGFDEEGNWEEKKFWQYFVSGSTENKINQCSLDTYLVLNSDLIEDMYELNKPLFACDSYVAAEKEKATSREGQIDQTKLLVYLLLKEIKEFQRKEKFAVLHDHKSIEDKKNFLASNITKSTVEFGPSCYCKYYRRQKEGAQELIEKGSDGEKNKTSTDVQEWIFREDRIDLAISLCEEYFKSK